MHRIQYHQPDFDQVHDRGNDYLVRSKISEYVLGENETLPAEAETLYALAIKKSPAINWRGLVLDSVDAVLRLGNDVKITGCGMSSLYVVRGNLTFTGVDRWSLPRYEYYGEIIKHNFDQMYWGFWRELEFACKEINDYYQTHQQNFPAFLRGIHAVCVAMPHQPQRKAQLQRIEANAQKIAALCR
jgi:hypothetical protein